MGLLTETVIVMVTSNQIKYYENLGYVIPTKKASESYKKRWNKDIVYDVPCEIEVNVNDLPNGSGTEVECLCDYCNTKQTIKYCHYKKSMSGVIKKYACKKCATLKAGESNMIVYGVKAPAQLPDVVKKMKDTTYKRYGAESYLQTVEGKKRIADTNMERYGSICPLNNPEVKKKANDTMMEKYGVINAFQSEEIKDIIKKNNLEKYGVEYTSQVSSIKEKFIETYNNRYHDNNPRYSESANMKRRNTFYNNQTVPTSNQQRYISVLYNMKLNYPLVYWNVDMYDENDIYVEYDGSGHTLSVKYSNITQEEFKQKEVYKFYTLKQHGYKMIRIISVNDYLPFDEILLQMLSDAKQYFSDYPKHSWINFDIDNNLVRNAEHKDGIPYFYGELRKIKKSDLESA